MSEATQTFNGWTNRETWATNLWLSNDELVYNQMNTMIRDKITEDTTDEEVVTFFYAWATFYLSMPAREEIGDFGKVNWLEIGRHWIDEVEL